MSREGQEIAILKAILGEKKRFHSFAIYSFLNALLKFKDRRFVPATESEKKFQKRLQEILKQNDFSV